jgi:uncharacterized protein YjbI with pentapeptide repeats
MAEEPEQENRDAPSNGDKPSRGLLIGFAIAGAILLVVFLWVWVNPSDPTEKKDFIQAVGVLLAALAGLGGLYFTRASTKDPLEQARENTEKQLRQARKSQEQTQKLTEQGQITDRFTRAIDQLGATDDDRNPRLEIRLGGIYALERIAWDSPERDHSTVMAVLTAYVRENSRHPPKSSKPLEGNSESDSTSNETAEADEQANQPAPSEPRRTTADIQAILDVLSRAQTRVPEEYLTRLDLHEANLQGANLSGANLQYADLQYASIQYAYVFEANFQGATLDRANFHGARLPGTIFREASLYRANLQDASLYRAILYRADLRGANLQGASFRYANLQYALRSEEANLQGAGLQDANLQDANLSGSNLQGAYLNRTNLQDAKVTDEQLASTKSLQGATMPGGQKYKDWLKDKEGSGKAVENE